MATSQVVYGFKLLKETKGLYCIDYHWLEANDLDVFRCEEECVYGKPVNLSQTGELHISEEDKNFVKRAHTRFINMGLSESEMIGYYAGDEYLLNYNTVLPKKMVRMLKDGDNFY
jgi:hypothetical protein